MCHHTQLLLVEMRSLKSFCLGWTWTAFLPISASWIARITCMSHCLQLNQLLMSIYSIPDTLLSIQDIKKNKLQPNSQNNYNERKGHIHVNKCNKMLRKQRFKKIQRSKNKLWVKETGKWSEALTQNMSFELPSKKTRCSPGGQDGTGLGFLAVQAGSAE
jgi:hypothetical protein